MNKIQCAFDMMVVAGVILLSIPQQLNAGSEARTRPNILWISCEDIGPDLGCYGDDYAVTPNLNKLAREGCRYDNAFVPFPVCAPTRSGIITGMYPGTLGAMHMRTKMRGYECVPPSYVKCFTEYLRAAGYYCSNHKKTDYQFKPPFTAWDAFRGDWRNEDRPKDAPFFSVINFTETHERKCRNINDLIHDPDKAEVPPYYPDTPIVRKVLARYYDNITAMDKLAGDVLKRLDEDGLRENTIVFFWGDHGRGLPRHKRWPYDTGLRVPLIIRWPGHIKPATVDRELVDLIDLAPTILSLAGLEVPETMQGRIILGKDKQAEPKYLYGGRNRMDENSYDFIRTVRDRSYRYIRNFTASVPYAFPIPYRDKSPIMKEWRRLHAEEKLVGPQQAFFEPTKPLEELYDTLNDPYNVNNLAESAEHQSILKRMSARLDRFMEETGDLGGVPEDELIERMWPGKKQPITATPVIEQLPGDDDNVVIKLSCPTEGASIGYQIEDGRWLLYAKPFKLKRGASFTAKAIRIGFAPSSKIRSRGK